MTHLLEASRIKKTFGGLVAVANLDLAVREGAIHGVIGPNGSGKTTLFNLISGIYRLDPGGRIAFASEDITNREPQDIARRGVARTFQLLRTFSEMSVLENLLVGCHRHVSYGIGAALFGGAAVRAQERRLRAEALELLEFVGLVDYADMPAAQMSIGQRRLLALARAMAMRPKLLMLDEPAAGLSPLNVDRLQTMIVSLQQRFGLTILIIEHVLKLVMDTCDTVTVLDHGEKIAEGKPGQVKDDHRVIEAYLGKEMNDAEVRAYLRA